MPAWSPEIANEFIKLAAKDERTLDQAQLQKLVYIAHGWCLADFGEPLTGDRPEAWEFGPVYKRLADALAHYGREGVGREITISEIYGEASKSERVSLARVDLEPIELTTIRRVYRVYGHFESQQLSALTQRPGTPWAQIFAAGAGSFRDIPHLSIRAQFVELRNRSKAPRPPV